MTGSHMRNTGPMRQTPRCGAKIMNGAPCEAPAVSGKARCRMNGGAAGSGAPKGNQSALKHGSHTEEAKAFRRYVRSVLKSGYEQLE